MSCKRSKNEPLPRKGNHSPVSKGCWKSSYKTLQNSKKNGGFEAIAEDLRVTTENPNGQQLSYCRRILKYIWSPVGSLQICQFFSMEVTGIFHQPRQFCKGYFHPPKCSPTNPETSLDFLQSNFCRFCWSYLCGLRHPKKLCFHAFFSEFPWWQIPGKIPMNYLKRC